MGKIKNLEDFIYAENKMDPLVKMEIIHYQLVATHLFVDGDGRTGRNNIPAIREGYVCIIIVPE